MQQRYISIRKQRGVVLFVVIMFLLIVTMLVLTGASSSTENERITRNILDRALAQSAALSGLRDGLRDLLADKDSFTSTVCTSPVEAQRPFSQVGTGVTEPYKLDCNYGLCYWDLTKYKNDGAPWRSGAVWGNGEQSTKVDGGCQNLKGGVPLGTFTGTTVASTGARKPEYMIELFPKLKTDSGAGFRVTARGFGADSATEVVVQKVVTSTGPAGGGVQFDAADSGAVSDKTEIK